MSEAVHCADQPPITPNFCVTHLFALITHLESPDGRPWSLRFEDTLDRRSCGQLTFPQSQPSFHHAKFSPPSSRKHFFVRYSESCRRRERPTRGDVVHCPVSLHPACGVARASGLPRFVSLLGSLRSTLLMCDPRSRSSAVVLEQIARRLGALEARDAVGEARGAVAGAVNVGLTGSEFKV